jgi:hypothetical protein
MIILCLLPFLLLFLLFNINYPLWGWRKSFLRAAIAWAAYELVLSEILGLLDGLTLFGEALGWGICILALVAMLYSSLRAGKIISAPKSLFSPSRFIFIPLALLAIILGTTFLVAITYPPQEYKVLHWQMSRVAHWAQQHSLTPFATGVENQNTMASGAQILILPSYILAGNDQLANMVQWFSMLGSLVCVSYIACQLGWDEFGQAVAAATAGTIPVGIALASSAEMENVLSFFVLCAVSESLSFVRARPEPDQIVFAGLASGLAIASKVTALVFLFPFAIAIAIGLMFRREFKLSVAALFTALLLTAIVNAGQLMRTYEVAGGLLEPAQVDIHQNRQLDLRGFASNLIRNMTMQLGTSDESINAWITLQVIKIHVKMGQDVNSPLTTAHSDFRILPASSGVGTSNPLQAVLILFCAVAAFASWKRKSGGFSLYTILTITTFALYSFLFKWQIFGGRYFLPFFLLATPMVGVVLRKYLPLALATIVCLGLFAYAWRYLVALEIRPLIGSEGIVATMQNAVRSRASLYFSTDPAIRTPYLEFTHAMRANDCRELGLMISGAYPAADYPLWPLLGAPQDKVDIEWIVAGSPSAKFSKDSFRPCAVICDLTCSTNLTNIRGLPLYEELDGFHLYADFPGK